MPVDKFFKCNVFITIMLSIISVLKILGLLSNLIVRVNTFNNFQFLFVEGYIITPLCIILIVQLRLYGLFTLHNRLHSILFFNMSLILNSVMVYCTFIQYSKFTCFY